MRGYAEPMDSQPIVSESIAEGTDLALLSDLERDLSDIESALARIDDGSYGVCERCGRPISAEKLEAAPAARFCGEDSVIR